MGNVTTIDLAAINNASTVTNINNNIRTLRDEFDKVVYKDGREELVGNLDANSKRIFNLGAPLTTTDAARLTDVQQYINTFFPRNAPYVLQEQRKEFTTAIPQSVFVFDYPALTGYIDVYLNGVRLSSVDYTHTVATVTFASPTLLNDVVVLIGYLVNV